MMINTKTYWYKIPHKKKCRYLVYIDGVLMQVSRQNYNNMERLLGCKPARNY